MLNRDQLIFRDFRPCNYRLKVFCQEIFDTSSGATNVKLLVFATHLNKKCFVDQIATADRTIPVIEVSSYKVVCVHCATNEARHFHTLPVNDYSTVVDPIAARAWPG